MAAENESPAREPATRGRGRGGRGSRGGRGRGGGRGGSSAAAAYERQRHLKATYQAVAHALKPALQELAERSIDDVLQNPDMYKHVDEHFPVIRELQDNLDNKLAEHKRRLQLDLQLAKDLHEADNHVAEQEFMNGFNEIEERFDQSQENRLRILHALHTKGLPVDVQDDQYEYKVISDEHFDKDFNIYECKKNGYLVPYPSRVEGTEMWQKARDANAAMAAAVAVAPVKGKGRGRGVNKRKTQEQPEGQPTPKRSTRNSDEVIDAPSLAPAPAKGLLASAAEVEANPEGTPGDEDSMPASPEPPNPFNGVGPTSSAKTLGKLTAREKSPPLPKNITEPDDYGFRIYSQKPSLREKGINSRLLAPRMFWFDDWEIGFRDSVNDSSKGHTRAKRGKYLDTPNSNGMHFDHWCAGYDYSATTPEDFDMEKVKRYGVHPKYGIFRPNRAAAKEEKTPYIMPGKPVVFIANPSGRISHASRSYLKTTNHRRSEDSPWRTKIGASLRRFCKIDEIDPEEVAISDFTRSDEELRDMSLGTAVRELEARPVVTEEPSEVEQSPELDEATPQPEGGFSSLSVLTYASAFLEAQESAKAAPPTPKLARYDAIRDVFTDSKPAAVPAPERNANLGLNLLAELSGVVDRSDEPSVSNGTGADKYMVNSEVPESDLRSTITRSNEPPPFIAPSQGPVDPRYNYAEVPQGYMPAHSRAQSLMQPVGQMHTHPAEAIPYSPIHDHAVQHQQVRPAEYQSHNPPPGPPMQDQGGYVTHGGYPIPDQRDTHMAAGRPIDPGYHPRRMSGFAADGQAFSRSFWPQQPPPGPSGPPPGSAPGMGPSQHYPSQPPPPRIPFSHNASAEPLPPLRPPRGRHQSVQEDTVLEPSMRPVPQNNMGGAYYPSGPTRPYHRGYAAPDSHAPQLQPISTERILPNPQQGNQGYMTSPHQGYAPVLLSPTYGNPQSMTNQMGQSPPGTPQGLSNSAHRHRSTPSGSSDAGNKYRKLQPAPVPAHRAWPNKPELKTIPYDHKEQGSVAALPSSGPTQIRGWNSRDTSANAAAQAERDRPKFKNIRFAEPLVGLPPLAPRGGPKDSPKRRLEVYNSEPVPSIEVIDSSPTPTELEEAVTETRASTPDEERPLKRRLRPKKPTQPDPELVITDVRPSTQRRKPAKTEKKKSAAKKTPKKKAAPRKEVTGAPLKNERASAEICVMREIQRKGGQHVASPIEIPDEDST
ncbi:hypothetical protein G7046_g7196 [Stylonectria norvegica]|nr:hypothetical protein G7046_g7196 [Stylonectria norvegica]